MASVQDLLTDLQRSTEPATKTAAESAPPALSDARTALQQQLAAVTSPQQPKTAAANNGIQDVNAVQELTKIAADLADADEAAQIKTAQLYGAAAADGFIQRMNQYAANAPQEPKVASVQSIHGDAQGAALTKMASELGYADAENALARLLAVQQTKEAQAQAYYQQHAHAQLPQQPPQIPQQPQAVKTAAEEVVDGIWAAAEKVAAASEDCFIRGYEAMDTIAQALT